MPADLALGKHDATYDSRDLEFAHYRVGVLPQLPMEFGQEGLISNWGMLGNDNYGDCVFAGAAHETMLWNAERGIQVPFDDKSVLSDYSAVTGFNPDDPNTDQGTNMREALGYRVHTGIEDARGERHKIGAYVALEPGNMKHIEEALFLFGVVALGIQVPQSAMDQFRANRPWNVKHASPIEGGHYVPVVGWRHKHPVCVTWSRLQAMSQHFLKTYCDEAYVILSPEMLSGGRSIGGFDLSELTSDLAILRSPKDTGEPAADPSDGEQE